MDGGLCELSEVADVNLGYDHKARVIGIKLKDMLRR